MVVLYDSILWFAHGGGGVTDPGGVPEHGDVALRDVVNVHGGNGSMLGLNDLFQP